MTAERIVKSAVWIFIDATPNDMRPERHMLTSDATHKIVQFPRPGENILSSRALMGTTSYMLRLDLINRPARSYRIKLAQIN